MLFSVIMSMGLYNYFETLDMVDYTLKDYCINCFAALLLNSLYKSWKSEPKMTKTVQIRSYILLTMVNAHIKPDQGLK